VIRLNACSILDVVHYGASPPLEDLQQEDFILFGRVIISVATGHLPTAAPTTLANSQAALEHIGRVFSPELREIVGWLLSPDQPPEKKNIDIFISGIGPRMTAAFNQSLQSLDTMLGVVSKEVENGRLFRLVVKLGTINERGAHDGDPNWSENGERYLLKLFRDYVFHQVDAQGNPTVDMSHIIRTLSKLDVGVDEQICLTSRDNETAFVVTYKELKKQLGNSFADLTKHNKTSRAAF